MRVQPHAVGRLTGQAVLALVALAACADSDFDAAPADRGAAAGARVALEAPAEEQAVAAPAEGGAEAQVAPAGDPARGQELFFANGCNLCHGDGGEGRIGPTIAQTRLTLDEVIAQYRDPRDVMPQFPADRVPDADVADIFAWLQAQPLPEEIVPGLGTPK